MISLYFLKLKIPIMVNKADTSFASCCLTKIFVLPQNVKSCKGDTLCMRKCWSILGVSIVKGSKRTVFKKISFQKIQNTGLMYKYKTTGISWHSFY